MMQETRNFFSFIRKSAPSEVWALVGGKRGVGVTTLALSVATALQRQGEKVLFLDTANHPGNLDSFIKVRPKFTLMDIGEGSATLEDTLIKGPTGLDLLTNTSDLTENPFQEDHHLSRLPVLMKQLKSMYNFILIDLGSGISLSTLSFLDEAQKVLVVVSSNPASIADTYALIKLVKKTGDGKMVVLVPNKCTSEEEGLLLHRKLNLITKSYLSSELIFGGSLFTYDDVDGGNTGEPLSNLSQKTPQLSYKVQTLVKKLISSTSEDPHTSRSLYQRFLNEANQIGLGK